MLENINFPIQEKKQFMDLIDHEQQTEENELTYKLALEQNTEAEKLRKVESDIYITLNNDKCCFHEHDQAILYVRG